MGTCAYHRKEAIFSHVLPYWNIHRHRVHNKLATLLAELSAKEQFHVLAGRIMGIEAGKATIQLRGKTTRTQLAIKWVINCLGPVTNVASSPLTQALIARQLASPDGLNMSFAMTQVGELSNNKQVSSHFYTLGTMRKGVC